MSNKDYMAEYRRRHKEYVAENNRKNAAAQRALRRLKNEHLQRYNELLNEELDGASREDS
jgi:hypothetical protein